MRAEDYGGAIRLYQQIKFDPPMPYVGFRLAIAYLLRGETDESLNILRSLQTAPKQWNSLPELTNRLLNAYNENPTPLGICIAAYDFFMFNPYYVWEKQTLVHEQP
jgi:hypothetical protein